MSTKNEDDMREAIFAPIRAKKRFDTWQEGDMKIDSKGFKKTYKEDRVDYNLIPIWFLERLAGLYTRGAKIYGAWNWTLAETPEALVEYKRAAFTHFIEYLKKDKNDIEDHLCAAVFNLIAIEQFDINKKNNN